MRTRFVVMVVLAVASCASPSAEPPAFTATQASSQALRGGVPDDGGLPEVYVVRVVFDTGMQFGCTGTLITSRSLLTAAHCFDPAAAPGGATRLTDVFVQNTVVSPDKTSPDWLRIDPTHTRLHPMWNASDRLSYDLALAALPAPSTTPPAPASFRTLDASAVGTPLTVVGFGLTGVGLSDNGTRRVATLPLKAVTAKHLQLGDGSSTGLCNGDSGGPSFLTGRDGRRRVAGVHSYDTSLQCNDGLDTRVDLFASFVQQFIRDEEGGPTCFEDGLCRSGCTPIDVDCVCAADGLCNSQCPSLLTDPDCAADCVADGACATQSCPQPDPDCTPELSPCSTDTQCQYRICTADPQRLQRYCSRPCSASCLGGTTCVGGVCLQSQPPAPNLGQPCAPASDTCLGGAQCLALLGDQPRCLVSCQHDADCDGEAGACLDTSAGGKACRPVAALGALCVPQVTRCLLGSCTGVAGAPTTCRLTCADDTSCGGDRCVSAQGGFKVCESVVRGSGCSSSWGLAPMLALLALRRRRRQPPGTTGSAVDDWRRSP